jgi:hypothetical protein
LKEEESIKNFYLADGIGAALQLKYPRFS